MKMRTTGMIVIGAVLVALLVTATGPVVARRVTPGMVADLEETLSQVGTPSGDVEEGIVYHRRLLREDLKLDIYRPFEPSGVSPVVIFFHGGSWVHGSRDMVRIIDAFTDKMRRGGIAVLSFDYTAGIAGGLRTPERNCERLLDWVAVYGEEYGLDTQRVVLYGVSAGGHLALMSVPYALDHPGIGVRAILEEYGPVDLEAMAAGDAFGYSRYLALLPSAALRKHSPVHGISAAWPPTIVFHGDADEIVSINQSRILVSALESAGVAHEFHLISGGNHGFFNKSAAEWGEMEDDCLAFIEPRLDSAK